MLGRLADAEGRLYDVRVEQLSLHASYAPAPIPDKAGAQASLL